MAVEGGRLFIRRVDHDGENCERASGPDDPSNCVGEQKTADAFTANFLITRKPPNKSCRNGVIAGETFCVFGRQIGDREGEGTQAVETDDPVLIVKGDEDTRHVAFLILPSAQTEPIIERGDTARKRRAVMLAERFDRFDHA